MRKRIWGSFLVVFCGWRECGGWGEIGTESGGWVLWKEEMEAAGKPGLAVDFFFLVSPSLGKWVGG